MRILYYDWHSNSTADICQGFEALAFSYDIWHYELSNYEHDEIFQRDLCNRLKSNAYDCIFPLIIYHCFRMQRCNVVFCITHGFMTVHSLAQQASCSSLHLADEEFEDGFLLSNYQPELAEFFVPGEELVLYDSMADLEDKVCYYLAHDEERKRIALNGYRKVCEQFSYEKRLKEMFEAGMK